MTTITLRQALKLVRFFGGHDCEVTIAEQAQDGAGGSPGLYAHCTEYPEEGAAYLGPTEVDDELADKGVGAHPNDLERAAAWLDGSLDTMPSEEGERLALVIRTLAAERTAGLYATDTPPQSYTIPRETLEAAAVALEEKAWLDGLCMDPQADEDACVIRAAIGSAASGVHPSSNDQLKGGE